MQITDRAKDVIKSGGEWISSVELENELMAHPEVVEAAVIAKPDERWAERPLCCVVLREGAHVSAEELLEHLRAACGQVVAARRVRLHRGGAQDERRQVRQEGAATPAGGGDAAGPGSGGRQRHNPRRLSLQRGRKNEGGGENQIRLDCLAVL